MAVSRRVARLAALAILGVAAIVPGGVAPAAAAAPNVALPPPTATVRFLDSITFEGRTFVPAGVRRVEIVIDIEGQTRSIVGNVEFEANATNDLRYVLPTPGGDLFPNTSVRARFRETLDDGTVEDGRAATVRYEDGRYDWAVLDGEFVTVHWTSGGDAFGRRALKVADDAVREVTDLLGVAETDPIDFYVYADNDAFYDVIGPGARENVGGEAHPDIRTLFAQISASQIDDSWVGIVIPHELTHLVFDTAVGNPYHYPPRWLNEGIAVYLSEGYSGGDRASVDLAVQSGSLIPLQGLSGQFPTTAAQFRLAYAESTSAVDFLVGEYGRPAMVQLVRSYADGVTDDEAFSAALGLDVAGFEAAWLDSLGAAVPSPYGPLDAPPGPVPSDWLGEGELPGVIPTGSPSASAPPANPERDGNGDATALLVGLLFAGAAVAGVGVWLARRNRVSVAAGGSAVEAAGPADVEVHVPGVVEGAPAADELPALDGSPPDGPSADGPALAGGGAEDRWP
ncbi:MAG TPA: peptidase MA family metallohydrolase [Candidatus Limnocylindrales bacterium]|nr:peptidase MA family metallohydrolase [Candidatus Limnocylindrales bacterium]